MDKGNWTYRKLGEVAEIINGKNQKSVETVNGKYPICGSGGVMGYASDYLCPENTIIIGRKGNINNPIFMKEKFWNVDTAFGIVANDSMNPKFLFYFCKDYDFEKHNVAVTIPSLRKMDLLEISVPVPPLEIQSRIVAELDCISTILEKKRQQLKELDNLAQAIFYDMFGDPDEIFIKWNYLTLEEVCLNIVDCPHTTPIKSETLTKYPCIRTSELKGGTIHWETMQYVNEDEYKKRVSRLVPQNGDIVYGREGSFGDAVILPQGWQFCLGQRTMLFRVNTNYVNTIFLHRVLISEVVLRQAKDKNVASTVAHVNVKDIKKFLIPLPPLALQQSFAAKIEAIEKQKGRISQSIKEVQTLFDSRMEEYFG